MSAPRDIALLGTPLLGDGYPHATRTLAMLRAEPSLRVVDCLRARPQRAPVARVVGSRWRALGVALGLAIDALRSLVAWSRAGRPEVAYVPYPAVPVLAWLSLLPRGWRPRRVVADAFIGWYDTAVVDRGLLRADSPGARVLRALERRALSAATVVMTDTIENAEVLSAALGLPRERFRAAPLATFDDAVDVAPRADASPGDGRVRLLFVGTFVPLQGAPVIAQAMALLPADAAVYLTVIGDGQDAPAFAAALAPVDTARVTWQRDFLPRDAVAAAVRDADICLGIFGDRDKSARVWPLKNYLYMRQGRCIVSSSSFGWPTAQRPRHDDTLVLIPPGDAQALADAIAALARDPVRRERLGLAARRHFDTELSNDRALAELLLALDPERSPRKGTA